MLEVIKNVKFWCIDHEVSRGIDVLTLIEYNGSSKFDGVGRNAKAHSY